MTRLPDTRRTELADTVERILAPDIDLHALARSMQNANDRNPATTWHRARRATSEQVATIRRELDGVTDHEPDLTLLTGGEDSPVYMQRWWLRRRTTADGHGDGGLYVHLFANDDPEELHNHPWPSASLLISGSPVFEDTCDGTATIRDGDIVLRAASHRHRIRLHEVILHAGTHGHPITPVAEPPDPWLVTKQPAMTLFCTGHRVQEWGFQQPDGSIKPVYSKQKTTGTTPRR
jgi:hypothetical protein